MNLVILLLKNGTHLISLIEELEFEPKCHLETPYTISGKTTNILTRWPSYTEDTDILLHSDSILTVCEPTVELGDKYLSKIGKTREDLTKSTPRVILNESDYDDPEEIDWVDDFVPDYSATTA